MKIKKEAIKTANLTELKNNPKTIAKYIDHTNVNPNSTPKDIKKLCNEAKKYSFCSVVVLPYYLKLARKLIGKSKVNVVGVMGFPFGIQHTKAKIIEVKEAFDFVDEFDMVMNRPAFKARDHNLVVKDIKAVVKAARGKPVKVIIESPELTDSEVRKATQLVLKAGASFVKTAVGLKGPAELKHIKIMKSVVGNKIGIKASGGIRSFNQALEFLKAGATRLGTSHGVKIITSGFSKEEGYFHE